MTTTDDGIFPQVKAYKIGSKGIMYPDRPRRNSRILQEIFKLQSNQ